MIRGRRLNRFSNQAFISDIQNRVTPTNIDAVYALTSLPTSYFNIKIFHDANELIQHSGNFLPGRM